MLIISIGVFASSAAVSLVANELFNLYAVVSRHKYHNQTIRRCHSSVARPRAFALTSFTLLTSVNLRNFPRVDSHCQLHWLVSRTHLCGGWMRAALPVPERQIQK